MVRLPSFKRRSRRTDIWPPLWRRRPVVVVLLVVAVAWVVYSRTQRPLADDYDRYHNRTFTCVRVVDGDTLDVDAPDGQHPTTRIRLWGVDTPEVAGRSGPAMYFGPEASAFVKAQLAGQPVRLVLAPQRTRCIYGRLLAYVYFGQPAQMLNEQLLEQGYAYADRRFPHIWAERFVELETRARRQKVGLWENVTLADMPTWRQRYEQWREEVTSTDSE